MLLIIRLLVARATWHNSSHPSQEQQQLLSALRAACQSPLSSNTLRLILALLLLSDFCASNKYPHFNSHHLIFMPEFNFCPGIALPQLAHLTKGANTFSRELYKLTNKTTNSRLFQRFLSPFVMHSSQFTLCYKVTCLWTLITNTSSSLILIRSS